MLAYCYVSLFQFLLVISKIRCLENPGNKCLCIIQFLRKPVKLNFTHVIELDNIKTEVVTKLLCRFQNVIM